MIRFLTIALLAALLLTGCSAGGSEDATDEVTRPFVNTPVTPEAGAEPLDANDVFSKRDLSGDYDEDKAEKIELSGTTTITEEGVYILTGTTNGQIIVDTDKNSKVQLVLAGVDVTCEGSAAIYVKSADKVFITLAEGTENKLTSTGEFTPDGSVNVDGAIFSRDDLTINGKGSLTVNSSDHGIVSKDDLKITGGKLTVTAESHALSGKDSVDIADGELTLTAGKDGIHSSNDDDTTRGNIFIIGGSICITAEGDGIDASRTVEIDGGAIDITSGGGSKNGETHNDGMFGGFGGFGGWGNRDSSSSDSSDDTPSRKGVKADVLVYVTGGTVKVNSADDALHSNGNVTISGGELTIATGDDGVHADGAFLITAGKLTITESYEGIEGKTITVAGGEVSVTASDDGLNASDGTGDVMGGGFGGGRGPGGNNGGFGGGHGPGGNDNGGFGGGRGPGGNDNGGFGGGNAPGGDIPGGDLPDGNPPELPGGEIPGAPDGSVSSGDAASGYGDIYLLISGGTLYVNAGGDGLDSNAGLYVTGGVTYVDGPTNNGNGAIDYATDAVITGGTVVAVGASGMAENFGTNSTQGSIMYNAQNIKGDITLRDSDGNVLASFSPAKTYSSVVVSAPGIEVGKTYTLEIGSSSVEITMTSIIYGSGSGMGGFGGRR